MNQRFDAPIINKYGRLCRVMRVVMLFPVGFPGVRAVRGWVRRRLAAAQRRELADGLVRSGALEGFAAGHRGRGGVAKLRRGGAVRIGDYPTEFLAKAAA